MNKKLKKPRLEASYRLHSAVANRRSRRALTRDRPALSPAQEQVLTSLRNDGLATIGFGELLGDDPLWQELSTDMSEFVGHAKEAAPSTGQAKSKDDFLKRSSKNGQDSLSVTGPWLRYALSDTLLGVVNSYLDLSARLVDLDKWYVLPSPPETSRIGSQRWHRDHIDRNIVKVFTYFSDVDAEAGALEYVKGSAGGGRYEELWPWKPSSVLSVKSNYPPEGELEKNVSPDDRCRATGQAGTIVFCDTSGFHRGGFASKPRTSSIFNYVSPASLEAGLIKRKFDVAPERGSESLTQAAKMALA